MGGFRDFFLGKKEKVQQFSPLNNQQNELLSQLVSRLGGALPSAFGNINQLLSNNPEAYRDFERPALRQFQEEILPSLAEGFGGLGAASSSGAQQTFARAGERLTENLAAQRAGLQQNAIQNLMGFLGQGLSPSQQTVILPGTQGLFGGVKSALGSGIGTGGAFGLLKLLGLF